jgi:hypothetical protein
MVILFALVSCGQNHKNAVCSKQNQRIECDGDQTKFLRCATDKIPNEKK